MAQKLGMGGAFRIPSTASQINSSDSSEWKSYHWVYGSSLSPTVQSGLGFTFNGFQIKLENGNVPIKIKRLIAYEAYQTAWNPAWAMNGNSIVFISNDGNLQDYTKFEYSINQPFNGVPISAFLSEVMPIVTWNGTSYGQGLFTKPIMQEMDFIYRITEPLYITFPLQQGNPAYTNAFLGLTVNEETIVTPNIFNVIS